jgi:hypothetical protein
MIALEARSTAVKNRLGRRRSQRVTLSFAIMVSEPHPNHGSGPHSNHRVIMERTHTLAVSRYGGLIALQSSVNRGQSLLMTNSVSRVSKECRIVYLGPKHRDKREVGVEFVDPVTDFWNISFPAPVSKPFLE